MEGLLHKVMPDGLAMHGRAMAKARREEGHQAQQTTTIMTTTPGMLVALHRELLFLIEETHYAW